MVHSTMIKIFWIGGNKVVLLEGFWRTHAKSKHQNVMTMIIITLHADTTTIIMRQNRSCE